MLLYGFPHAIDHLICKELCSDPPHRNSVLGQSFLFVHFCENPSAMNSW